MALVRNRRARRYVLRMRPDGSARVTIPLGGSPIEARRFLERNRTWLERQLVRLDARVRQTHEWTVGTAILFRGESVTIESRPGERAGTIQFASETVRTRDGMVDVRLAVERHLWKLATSELPPRVHELAAANSLTVQRVSVRNQRTRWGSCSRRGTISLNWRLIQAPPHVRDYIIFHELCHLRQMNHSPRFWAEVERACPEFRVAEQWLKRHSDLLR